jgi:hypothetical protein
LDKMLQSWLLRPIEIIIRDKEMKRNFILLNNIPLKTLCTFR